jgi:glycosyltransferase involved in cell wall biosynthesis
MGIQEKETRERIRLSAVVITRNEERNLAACLESVYWADEIVVVDAMSEDATCEIARRFTSRVHCRPWSGFAEARRFGLEQASGEWVLALDADERVTRELREEIETALAGDTAEGFMIPRKAFFLGRWIRHCGWYPGYVLRLFRKDRVRVTDRLVHEGYRVRGTVGVLAHPFLHYTYPDIETYFERFGRYTTLAARELAAAGRRARPQDLLLRPPLRFVGMYLVKLGLLDGIQGLILCVFSSLYVFVKYAKLWEIHRSEGRGNDED